VNSELSKERAPVRQVLPQATPPWVRDQTIFFITVCCADRGANQLCKPPIAKELFEAVEFRTVRHDWYAHLFLLMPDHLHALLSFPRDREMKKVVANWKEITAKRAGVHWQRDFFDHRLRAEESYEEKAHYIRMNPVRKGLVADPTEWSFKWEPNFGGPSGPALPQP